MGTETKEGSPDKDKSLELEEEPISEMGKGEEVPESEEEGTPSPPDKEKVEEVDVPEPLRDIMLKKGFKTLEELAESYKNQETKITEQSKDARLSRLTFPSTVPPRPGAKDRSEFKIPEPEKDPYQMSKEEFADHIGKVVSVVKAEQKELEADREWNAKYAEAISIIAEDPKKFERLRPIVADLYRQHPGHSLRNYMVEAERLEKEYKTEQKKAVLEDIGLDPEDIPKLKTILGKTRMPRISETSAATGGGTLTKEQKEEAKLIDDILKTNRLSE